MTDPGWVVLSTNIPRDVITALCQAPGMANFFKPAYAADGYVSKQPYGLSFVKVPINATRDIALFGGQEAPGRPLWVSPNDFDSANCVVTCTEQPAVAGARVFRVKGNTFGSTMLEARAGGRAGPLWDFVQIVVGRATIERTGPMLGSDGPIPAQHVVQLKHALDKAWELTKNSAFLSAFADVVSKLSFGKAKPSPDLYANALNRMVINLADTSREPRVKAGIAQDAIEAQQRAVSGLAPAMSFQFEPNVWIRAFALEQGTRQITSCIFHEAAHVAGARGDPLAEFALDVLHRSAGIPR